MSFLLCDVYDDFVYSCFRAAVSQPNIKQSRQLKGTGYQ